eukprot:scaffold12033_cov125-Isochrysis_galbana.AAC.7
MYAVRSDSEAEAAGRRGAGHKPRQIAVACAAASARAGGSFELAYLSPNVGERPSTRRLASGPECQRQHSIDKGPKVEERGKKFVQGVMGACVNEGV